MKAILTASTPEVIRIEDQSTSAPEQTVSITNQEIVRFHTLIARISARLIRTPSDVLDDEIHQAVREILQPLGVDRGGLLEIGNEPSTVRVSHVWYDDGIQQVGADINLAAMFPWSYRKIVIEGKALALADCQALPAEAGKDQESHRFLGNLSTLTIPLFIGDRVHHLVTVDAHRARRNWPDELIDNLRLLGEIFVSALQRRENERTLRQTRDRLDLAAASAHAGLWELDLTTGKLWTTDQARQMFGYGPEEAVTLENFMTRVHIEDRPVINRALAALSSDRKDLDVEYRIPGYDGRQRWMHSFGRLSTVDGNLPPHLTGVTLEITQRKQMEQKLQEQLQEIERLQQQIEEENSYLRNELAGSGGWQRIEVAGQSISMQEVLRRAEQVASTGSTVLIQGETGTGKELIAQTIHRLSSRSKRVMVKVNCAALPAALVESELFGREKGAFTGALSQQAGRFELADGSTLFLDEIAEMPPETQAKLLRVLQEGEFERLGSPRTIKVDVRVIAASNRNLSREVEQGRFRRDLYYRLNVFPIHIPPLRERVEDIPNLVWQFINEFGERMGKNIRRITIRDMELLKTYSWPGNIRELRNVIEHALIVSGTETLELQRFADMMSGIAAPTTLEAVERQHIQKTLSVTHGRIKGPGGAAERLGLNPSTLYSRMQKLGIKIRRA